MLLACSRKSYLGLAEMHLFVPCVTSGKERFSLNLLESVKSESVTRKWDVGVCLGCELEEFVTIPGFIQ